MTEAAQSPEFEALLDYLKESRGFDFTGYKRTSLSRRIQKRIQVTKTETIADYKDYLEVHPDEFVQLFNTILINVTGFFRDASVWNFLAEEIIPRILAGKQPGETIRVWCAGVASGEEAYSIAMLLAETLEVDQFRQRVKIFATDVDEEALAHARLGSYSPQALQGVPAALQEKYFERGVNQYLFHKELRRSIIFGRNDLVQDAPISRLDLLICRNTLMYFNSETQAKILRRFHYALNDNGYLCLGKAEMLLSHNHMFTSVDLRRRIFMKVPEKNRRDFPFPPIPGRAEETVSAKDLYTRLRDAAFEIDPSAAQLVVDLNGFLVLANERGRTLFGLTPHDLNRPLQDLGLSYRPVDLRSHISEVMTALRPVVMKEIAWPAPMGEPRFFDLQLIPLIDSGGLIGVKVIFTDVTRYKELEEELRQSHQELETAYEELQSTNEELETTNEELQSTVEELETTNEELQSTNEELETMNEELQSTNEELETSNTELRARTEEVNEINAYLTSILTSLGVGVVVVDSDLQIRIWNQRSEELWGLKADEVIGKPFLNLDIGLPVERLKQPILACLAGETTHDGLVLEALNRRGRPIRCKIGCTPLYGPNSHVRGAILLIEDEQPESARVYPEG